MLLQLLGKVIVRIGHSVSLKNSCNEKLSKVGVIEVGKIKTRAGKQGTHSKGFRENMKFLRALNTPTSI